MQGHTDGGDRAGAALTVDLGALRENYRILKGRLGRGGCAGVVKADGYGLGAVPVARALAGEGCRRFFVAHVEEGIVLRAGLGDGPAIGVLNGLPRGAEADALAAGLEPVLNSLAQARAWQDAAKRAGRPLPAAIQVDTGMARLGLPPEEFARLVDDPQGLAGITPTLLMSHLAVAEEPDHPANAVQLDAFLGFRHRLPDVPASLANSSGVFLGPAYAFDLARPGAALYGINPTPRVPNPMRAVASIWGRVVQTREVPSGAGIGYGHTAVARQPMRLSTLSIGYADGWPRRAEASGFLDGVELPFVGRVSMDSIIIDVSALPEGRPEPGTEVELLGPHRSVDALGLLSGTIGYEILTGLGSRFSRRYLNDTV